MPLTCIKRKFIVASLASAVTALACVAVYAAYIPTKRDTKLPPQAVLFEIPNTAQYEFLSRAGDFEYWYRGDRDIIMIKDLKSGYTWKTGLDAPVGSDADTAARQARANPDIVVEPKEERLNATYIALANSLLSAEIFDDSNNIMTLPSTGRT
jgi:hypothetical protein